MALTTKFINTPITISLSKSLSISADIMILSASTAATSRISTSSILLSSTITSTIYTVPSGRTAKVYFPPQMILNVSRSASISVSMALYGFGLSSNGLGYNLEGINYLIWASLLYNAGYEVSQYLSSIAKTTAGDIVISGSLGAFSSNYSSVISDITTATKILTSSSLYDGGYPYIYMGPGDSIYYQISASLIHSRIVSLSRSSGGASLNVIDTGPINLSFELDSYLYVIEEAGS